MMRFHDALATVAGHLYLEKRLTYHRLRKEFELDDETIKSICYELIVGRRCAVDENGEVLVWAESPVARVATSSSESIPVAVAEAAQRISAEVPPSSAPARDPKLDRPISSSDAERRQLTVMFCDLVGSTALSTQMDPEDLREVIASFHDRCREAIERYDGFIARYMGDGLLVYFGYPRAHEDEAERAVRAGLDIMASMTALNADVGKAHGVVLAARTGVATGPVVVGDLIGEGAAEEAAVVGETPNLAARLQSVAQPNQVVVGQSTRHLLGEQFELENVGTYELKGIAEPQPVWRVVSARDTESRYAARHATSASSLVGRQEELGLLLRAWEGSREGRGHVVLIQGEAGIGKSRLVEALREQAGTDYTWIALRSSPYHTASTLHPIIEHLKRVFQWQPEDGPEARLDKLDKAVRNYQGLSPDRAVPLFAALMSLPLPARRYPPLDMTPKQQRDATLDALNEWLTEEAERHSMLMVWEDLHWADATTVEMLSLLMEQVPTVPMLVAGTFRPEFRPPWPQRSHMTPITLSRLEPVEVRAIVSNLAGGKTLPEQVLEHIVTKADGVPLYVEELTKTILSSEVLKESENRFELNGSLTDMQIPETLQDSLMARLDRIPTVREVAQLGSVLGREFAYEILQSLAPHEEAILQDGLQKLVENELLYQRGRGPRARYVFKHALIQDAAYQSLLKRTRQQYHRQVAELISQKLPETVVAQPELLAHHFSEAGCYEQAIEHWLAAGHGAAARSANAESIAHLRRGLADAHALPDTPERAHAELELQTHLGAALIATMGYGAQEVKDTYTAAKSLCDRVGSDRDQFAVQRGLWNSYLFAAEMDEALDRGEELLRLAENIGDSQLVVEAHRVMATALYVRGDFADAWHHAKQGIESYDPEKHGELALLYGADPAVVCKLYGAKALWMLGYPEQAQTMMGEAMVKAHELAHGHTKAFALCYEATLHQYSRNVSAAARSAALAVDVASEHGIRQWLAWATVLSGWAIAMGGQHRQGIERLQEGMDSWRLTDRFGVPYFLALKAEALESMGQLDGALETVSRGLTLVGREKQGWYMAELHRQKGAVLAQVGRSDDAEGELLKAVEVARAQSAKSLELRAALGLSHLWQRQGKAEEACATLREAQKWFTEGFESADLQEARILLAESS